MCNVNIATGEVMHFAVDFYLPGLIPFHWTRTYLSGQSGSYGPLGYGWRHGGKAELRLSGTGVEYIDADGDKFVFPGDPEAGPLKSLNDGLVLERSRTGLRLTLAEGEQLLFEPSSAGAVEWRLEVRQDAYANSVQYLYDSADLLREIIDSNGRTLFIGYDLHSRIAEVRIDRDVLVAYGYDGAGDLVSAVDRSGAVCGYRYRDHLLVEITNRIQNSLYYAYDDRRRCIYTWRPGGTQFRRLLYDDKMRSTLVVNSRGFQTLYEQNEKGFTERETDPFGEVREDTYDGDGNVVALTSTSGNIQQTMEVRGDGRVFVTAGDGVTEFTLNDNGLPTRITSADGSTSMYEYDHGVNVKRIVHADGSEWHFSYDGAGALVDVTDPKGHQTRLTRDGVRITSLQDKYGVFYRAVFDQFGFPGIFEDAIGRRTRIEWTKAGDPASITYPDGGTALYTYDADGNMLSATDEVGNKTEYRYDANGGLTDIVEPDGATYQYAYDHEDNLVAFRNAKGETAWFEYDALNRGTAVRYADGSAELFRWDARGNMFAVDDAEGRSMATFEYDTTARLVKKVFPNGASVQIAYGPKNEILAVANLNENLQYKYDAEMRIAKVQSHRLAIEYQYDQVGNRTKLATSRGRVIEYEWDGRRRLVRMTDAGVFSYEFVFNETDFIRECRLPNGLQIKYSYDLCGRMAESIVIGRDGSRLGTRSYEYDVAGRLRHMADGTLGLTDYDYDVRDRLIRVRRNGAVLESYSWDADGNLASGPNREHVVIGSGDRVIRVGETGYEYDRFGNTAARNSLSGRMEFSWGWTGELMRVDLSGGASAEYEYDPLGRRIAKRIGAATTSYFWDGVAPLEEECGSGPATRYLFMPGSFFPAGLTIDGQHYSYWLDQIGTPIALFDGNGEIAWAADYTAFGELRAVRGNITNPFRFQGQYFDPESGLCCHQYRYYDPVLCRFISPDPIGFNGGLNLYSYVPNPVNWVDPFGLVVCEITPKCSWGKSQQEDAKKKVAAMDDKIGNGIPLPKAVPGNCANRKNAKDIYNDCRAKGHPLPPLKKSNSRCSNQQADHIIEVVAGGGEHDCKNLQPLIETVNKSYGSQMAKCAKANPGKMLTGVKLLTMAKCRPGGRQCP